MSAVATGVEGAGSDDDADDPTSWSGSPTTATRRSTSTSRPCTGAARRDSGGGVERRRWSAWPRQKSKLRKDNADLVAHLVQVTGKSHREVNGELNRLAGVRKVTEATAEQLSRRIAVGEKWVRTL